MNTSTKYYYHEWRPCLGEGLDQFLLHAREVEVGRIVALSNCGRSRDATASGDHDHCDLGIARLQYCLGEARPVIAKHLTAFGEAHLDIIAESRTQARKGSDVRRKIWTGCI